MGAMAAARRRRRPRAGASSPGYAHDGGASRGSGGDPPGATSDGSDGGRAKGAKGGGGSSGENFLNSFFGTGSSVGRPIRSAARPRADAAAAAAAAVAAAAATASAIGPRRPISARGAAATSARSGARGGAREQLETDIIRSLLVSYYGIVRKNLLDSVPKAIMHFLVNSVRANVQEELVIALYKEDEFADMLCEADDTVRRRDEASKLVASLERASRIFDELRAMPAADPGVLFESLSLS